MEYVSTERRSSRVVSTRPNGGSMASAVVLRAMREVMRWHDMCIGVVAVGPNPLRLHHWADD